MRLNIFGIMVIETTNAKFLIESDQSNDEFVLIYSNSSDELQRFFGSLNIHSDSNEDFPFKVFASKNEFANALIIMVKEIDYSDSTFQSN